MSSALQFPILQFPKGFKGGAVAAGIKKSGLDLALIVNEGPSNFATGVFTSNQILAAPVVWTQKALQDSKLKAVLLNSGGANACTGKLGEAAVSRSAEEVAQAINSNPQSIGVCSTGMIGVQLPMESVVSGIKKALEKLSDDSLLDCASAIMTTDSHPKTSLVSLRKSSFAGIDKGACMLAPSLATMLSVVMTDAVVEEREAEAIFLEVCERTFNRVDSDGCTSTNDTVLFLASGASGEKIENIELRKVLTQVCSDLALQLISDAEGHTKIISIKTKGARSERDAVEVGRACARNNLLKCALFGEDPNWGRVLAAIGTTKAIMDPNRIDVTINGVRVCIDSAPGESRERVNLKKKDISIVIDLKSGDFDAEILTNDLSVEYVHENSAYST
jgi:glutamate N-acetyltransferase/amino-acid N-acetyltransferase